jgi:hypothetical protein
MFELDPTIRAAVMAYSNLDFTMFSRQKGEHQKWEIHIDW